MNDHKTYVITYSVTLTARGIDASDAELNGWLRIAEIVKRSDDVNLFSCHNYGELIGGSNV